MRRATQALRLQAFASFHPGHNGQTGKEDPDQRWGKNLWILMRGRPGKKAEGGKVEDRDGKTRKRSRNGMS